MRLSRGLNRNLDGRRLRQESEENVREMNEKTELGQKHMEFKEKQEEYIERVQRSDMSDEEKRHIIEAAIEQIEIVKENYEANVVKEIERLQEEHEEIMEAYQELSDELERAEEAYRNIDQGIDANVKKGTDHAAIADDTAARREAYERDRDEFLKDQALRMEMLGMMNRNMREDKVRNVGR